MTTIPPYPHENLCSISQTQLQRDWLWDRCIQLLALKTEYEYQFDEDLTELHALRKAISEAGK